MKMADQQLNRQHSDGEEHNQPEQKHQKLDETEDKSLALATKAEAKPISITNINYNRLERIFDLLDLEALLNLAQTCKRLQIAAAAKFSDEHGNKAIVIQRWIHVNRFRIIRDTIRVIGLKFLSSILALFRCQNIKIKCMGGRCTSKCRKRSFGTICQSVLC